MTNLRQKTKTLVMNGAVNYALTSFILIAALFYVYFANTAVRTLTVLEKTKQQVQSLSAEVSKMESEHLSVENNMNTDMALQLGLVEIKHPIFIVKNSKKTSLSLKTD